MNKKKFEKELAERLKILSVEERQRILDYYNELYLEKLENGESEQEIIQSFGSAEEIAEGLVGEGGTSKQHIQKIAKTDKPTVKWYKNKTFWIVYFSLFYITIPLTAAAIGVAAGLGAGAVGLAVGLGAVVVALCAVALVLVLVPFICGFAFVVAGPVYSIYGIFMMFTNFGAGLVQVAAGLLLFALGIAFLQILRIGKIFQWKRMFPRRSKFPRVMGILGGVAAAASICMAVTGFGIVGWDVKNFDNNAYIEYVRSGNEIVEDIQDNTKTRNVKTIDCDEGWRIETFNTEDCIVSVSYVDGTLIITEEYKAEKYWVDQVFNIFSWLRQDKQTVKIYVNNH